MRKLGKEICGMKNGNQTLDKDVNSTNTEFKQQTQISKTFIIL